VSDLESDFLKISAVCACHFNFANLRISCAILLDGAPAFKPELHQQAVESLEINLTVTDFAKHVVGAGLVKLDTVVDDPAAFEDRYL